MRLFININNNGIFSTDTKPELPMMADGHPNWYFTLFTPTISGQFNEDDDGYASNVYSLSIHAPTSFIVVHTDGGTFWKVCLFLLCSTIGRFFNILGVFSCICSQ